MMHFFINRVEFMESFPPFFSGDFLDHSYFIQAESLRDFPFAQRVSGIGRNCFSNALMHMGTVSPMVPSRSKAISLIIVPDFR